MSEVVVDVFQLQCQWECQYDRLVITCDLSIYKIRFTLQFVVHIHFQCGVAYVLAQIQFVEVACNTKCVAEGDYAFVLNGINEDTPCAIAYKIIDSGGH